MRSLLVHDYVRVDPQIVWQAVDERLADLEAVRDALAQLPEVTRR